MTEDEALFTTNDLAARWRVTPKYVADLRQRGEGPLVLRLGRCVRYRLAEILAWEEGQVTDP